MCGQNWEFFNLNWFLGPGPVHLGAPAGPVQGQTTSGAVLQLAAGTDGPHGYHRPPTALTGLRHCTEHAPSNAASATAGARRHGGREWAVCCCVRVVTTAFDHASTTDGTDVLGVVDSVVFGWGGHERAAWRAASCRRGPHVHERQDQPLAGQFSFWIARCRQAPFDRPMIQCIGP